MKKVIAVILIAVLGVMSLTGCGNSAKKNDNAGTNPPVVNTPDNTPPAADTTDNNPPATDNKDNTPTAPAVESGSSKTEGITVLTMGTNAEFQPFEFVAEKGIIGQFDGVDVAIAAEIGKALGVEIKIEDMVFESLLIALDTGNVDFVAAGMTATDERKQSVDFSIPYYNATQYIIVREDGPAINSSADIIDKKVGVVDGYTGQQVCMDTLKIKKLEGFKKSTDAVMALIQGKVDAVVIDSHTALAMVRQNSGLKIVEDSAVFENEQYAIAVKKGNDELLTKINEVLQKLIDDGKIDEFVANYSIEE